MQILDQTRGSVVARKVRVANRFFERLRGLIGRPRLQPGEAFWLPFCQGVHTFGMKYPIDVVFLNKENRVVKLVQALQPNSFSPVVFQSASVLELPEGTLWKSKTQTGNVFQTV